MPVLVMGVLNVTPDSFSDGGRWMSHDAAVEHALRLISDGADVIDIGGESTRPGAEPVTASEEIERVLPVVEAVSRHARVSIDTMKADVAEAAVRAGATIVNDVSATLHEVAARHGVGWIAMHMQGDPRTMQADPSYQDVVEEVHAFLESKGMTAKDAGVSEIWIDPGIGFGKTLAHNLSLLRHLDRFTDSAFPVLVGTSRKSFIGKLLATDAGQPPANDRLEASLATVAWAATQRVSMVRVHDVKQTVRVLRTLEAVQEAA